MVTRHEIQQHAAAVGEHLARLMPQATAAMEAPEGAYDITRWQQVLAKGAVRQLRLPNDPEFKAKEDRPGIDRMRAETFGRLYGDPKEREQVRPEHRWMKRVHDALDAIPDFQALQARCQGDEGWATVAMQSMYEAAIRAAPLPTKAEARAAAARDGIEGLCGAAGMGLDVGGALASALADLQEAEDATNAEQGDGSDDSELRHALREAISEAIEEVDAAESALSAFTGSGGSGSAGQQRDDRDPAKRIALAKRLKADRELQAILAEAGRLRRVISAKRATRASHVAEELCDVEVGGDVERLLPSELALLRHPLARLDAFRRILERSALQYRLKGNEKQGRGPIIICIDESGSMGGARNTWAKGLALALLDMAGKEKRGFGYVAFDSSVTGRYFKPEGATHDPAEVLNLVRTFSGGGTSFEPPLKAAMKMISAGSLPKADIIFITDGEAGFNGDFAKKFAAFKAETGTTVYGFPIGFDTRTMQEFCDTIVKLDGVGSKSDDGATTTVASI